MMMQESDRVLAFWFGAPTDPDHGQPRKFWFDKSDAFDADLRERFEPLVQAALQGDLDDWAANRDQAGPPLAFILLLDQFTRNIYRGTDRMFAGDPQALACAQAMVGTGQDLDLLPVQRQFCYLPFEHAEDIDLQAQSIRLFDQLRGFQETADLHEWARRHQVIIERFGRFPHRNAMLGRTSTVEELAFLDQPGSSF